MISDIVGLNPKLQTTAMPFVRSSSTSGENTFLKNNTKYNILLNTKYNFLIQNITLFRNTKCNTLS